MWDSFSTGVVSTPRANTTDLGPEVARNITHEICLTTTNPSHSVPDSSKGQVVCAGVWKDFAKGASMAGI
ncbi:hypothetical protein CB0940_10577 [Cercospora beticola]|uniref:Uncharacterized protein n=1 Tax=Cercospora beticola TaxID=122368 RepID=A0A2G5HUW2_CERBT|nr:hypothetical protein CB0940_10577 [Cercospora beticola]PIA96308.1 hypothetical protein CB0940_10577 [Cercospora beticola]WPB07298.1 hypothetical protein RHO25_011959 [Cercospora beticola]